MKTSHEEKQISTTHGKRNFNITGVLFSLIVTAAFVWATMQWYALLSGSKQETVQNTQWYEQRAFLNLQSIAEAQSEYIKTDWDGDGKKTYAKYFIHLWTSVDINGNPMHIGFIPKKLAFATGPARLFEGYYFVDLQDRILPETGEIKALDYEKEWAVLAIPLTVGGTERLHFLADKSGDIFVKSVRYVPQQYIDDPLSNGWTKISSATP